jgi:signal transduction histidine kinase/ligand-binding sensor domain-containing protein/DNA-binding response OmpR family regulator
MVEGDRGYKFLSICILNILLYLFLLSSDLYAQIDQPRFKHLTTEDGLSQNAVFALYQDSRGFMWFGTKDGLNRYDGYSFTIYQHNPFDSTSISANYITALFEDRQGNLWIGTYDGGLNRFMRESEVFQRISNIPMSRDDTGTFTISVITGDSTGNIWMGTAGNGLFKLSLDESDPTTLPDYVHYKHQPGIQESLSDDIVNSLLVDHNDTIWIGTQKRLNRLHTSEHKTAFHHYIIHTKHPDAPTTHQDSSVSAIFRNDDESLWLGTTSGIAQFNPADGSYIHYPHHYQIFRYGWGRIVGIIEDRTGYLWLATPGELMRFDPERKSYDYFRNDPFNPESINFNGVSSLYRDRTGILWFGTPGYGINMAAPKADRFNILRRANDRPSRISGFSVRAILEDDAGDIWIGTETLYRWDRSTGELKSLETTPDRVNEFGNVGPWAMLRATKSSALYFATHAGLFRLDTKTGEIRQFTYDPDNMQGLPQQEVFAVFEDREGNIWIATKNYVSKFVDEEIGRFLHFQYTGRIIDELVRPQIHQNKEGSFWIGTDNGLLRFDPNTQSFHAYRNDPLRINTLSNNDIKSIHPDPDEPERILWLGTAGGGLNRFDIELEDFQYFTIEDGLPNNVIYGILADESGHLWLSTNKGLSRFDRKTETFKNYDISDGLQSNEFNTGAFFKSESGEMFFGGIHGLNYFYPADIIDNPFHPNVVITGLAILNRAVSHQDENSVLQKSISETDAITLPHSDNIVSFQFAALDFSAPEKNLYEYKLEGFHKDWIYSGTQRTATFTNLKPGTYTFRVRGSNNDGVWSDQEASIVLIIEPPFYGTWWAYLLYLLAGVSILFGLRRYEMNRARLKNELRLEHINRDRMKELDTLKSRFFANISHELRTPLTLILGPAEQLSTDIDDDRLRHKSRIIYSNAKRLLRLINQLLDISRLESGSMKLHAGLYDIVPFVRGITMSFSAYAERKRMTLQFVSTEPRIALYFDRDKAEKIFINIISNAIKFTPSDGSVSVELSIKKGATPSAVDIAVYDTGIGIPSDQLQYVFDRFYQVGGASSYEREGTGIGLALVKELVELHRGTVTVASEIGKGSVFTVSFPLGKEHLSPDEITDQNEDTYDSDSRFGDNGDYIEEVAESPGELIETQTKEDETLILIVEDNKDLREYIREQIIHKYTILEAKDGADGFEIASERIPDLIISDVIMPRMNGYEFCRKLKTDQRTSHIPFILLTAKAGEKDKFAGLQQGADDYLIKPFSTEELLVRVDNLIESRRRLREKYSGHIAVKPTDVAVTSVDKKFLERVLSVVESHLSDVNFSVEILARNVNMSQSQMHRKLKALTDLSANQFIRSIRMQRALELLKKNAGNVAEVAYMVGYDDPGYFTRTFKNYFEYLPSDVKRE